jgi:uncharacterized protein (DUF433 family)
MESIQYVEEDKFGHLIIVGTRIHVQVVGFAHEGGLSEEALLKSYSLTKVQLYGALAYFYGHRDEIMTQIKEAYRSARKHKRLNRAKHKAWKRSLAKKMETQTKRTGEIAV